MIRTFSHINLKYLQYRKFLVPLASISLIHNSTTTGISVFWAFTKVVRSIPNIRFTYFMSGIQSFGTFSEHFLWALNPQSKKQIKTSYLMWSSRSISPYLSLETQACSYTSNWKYMTPGLQEPSQQYQACCNNGSNKSCRMKWQNCKLEVKC